MTTARGSAEFKRTRTQRTTDPATEASSPASLEQEPGVEGFPGFLAFLSLQEWPAREPCPNCQRLRNVDREKCEHCGAGFAPPETKGTEIFERVEMV